VFDLSSPRDQLYARGGFGSVRDELMMDDDGDEGSGP
jgi:hypothetical protein